jgi:hypothetical protein
LFGFVMASISLFASAKDNTLIQNTMMTRYLPNLVHRLHLTMGLLLLVCTIFLIVLFVPDSCSIEYGDPQESIKYTSVLVTLGIFVLINSFYMFVLSWNSFKNFTSHM